MGIIFALMALGLTLIFSILNIINFAHGEIYMIGAFTGLIVISVLSILGLNQVAIIVIAALVAVISQGLRSSLFPPDEEAVGRTIRINGHAVAVLGVAEGIETALAVHLRTGMPIWSAISAGLLARTEPPAGTSLVVVWADWPGS